jgi:hypothetical protein
MDAATNYYPSVSKIYEEGGSRDACPACQIACAAQPLTAWMRLERELQLYRD